MLQAAQEKEKKEQHLQSDWKMEAEAESIKI